jgi:hypothetical protein
VAGSPRSWRAKVTARVLGIPVGPYVITRLLPLVGNDPHYQGKSDAGTVRALLASEIRELEAR